MTDQELIADLERRYGCPLVIVGPLVSCDPDVSGRYTVRLSDPKIVAVYKSGSAWQPGAGPRPLRECLESLWSPFADDYFDKVARGKYGLHFVPEAPQ